MAATYEVGTKVKVTLDDLPYAGTVITYTDSIYKVSVEGLGLVLSFEDSEIEGAL